MKYRPILFNPEMVRAYLNGHKTQTRRIFKRVSADVSHFRTNPNGSFTPMYSTDMHTGDAIEPRPKAWNYWCPKGVPGDRLWVRETVATVMSECPGMEDDYSFAYRADYPDGNNYKISSGIKIPWTPSIFMPREASRSTLDIVSIRLERVDTISEADAWAEGFPDTRGPTRDDDDRARRWFRKLWGSINGTPKPVKAGKDILAYECFPWSHADFEEAFLGKPQLTAGEYPRLLWRGHPLHVHANPWVWAIAFPPINQ